MRDEEVVGALGTTLREEPRIATGEQPGARLATDQVADLVTQERGEHDAYGDHPEREVKRAAGQQDPGREQE